MLFHHKPYTLDRLIHLSVTAAFIWGGIWVLNYLSDVLIPFFVAFLLAYMINPLVLKVQKRVKKRAPAIFITLFLVIAGVVAMFWLIIPLMGREITAMRDILANIINNSELAARASQHMPEDLWKVIKEYAGREEIRDFFHTGNFIDIARSVSKRVLPGIWGLISGTASLIWSMAGLLIIVLYVVFLLLDYHKLIASWEKMLPPEPMGKIHNFLNDFDAAMRRYFRAQAMIAAIVGMLFAIGFEILGLPMGIFLGLFIGLLNMVPYLQIIGLIPAFILAAIHAVDAGMSFWAAEGLMLLVFAIVQLIQDTILVPKIMGKATGLSPAVMLLSLSIWGKFLGMLGLLIALPMTCLLIAYYQRFLLSLSTEETTEGGA